MKAKTKPEKAKVIAKAKEAVSKKTGKAITNKEFKELLDKLIKKYPEYAEFKGYTKDEISRDAKRIAKHKGKRVSKDGNTYYEYRTNRTDVKPKDKL